MKIAYTASVASLCYEETNEFLSGKAQTQRSLLTSADLPETFDKATQAEYSLTFTKPFCRESSASSTTLLSHLNYSLDQVWAKQVKAAESLVLELNP